MTAASPGDDELADAPEEKQLFRAGSVSVRTESLLHSLLILAGAILVSSLAVSVGGGLLKGLGYANESAPVLFELVETSLHFLGFLAAIALYVDYYDARSMLHIRRPTRRDIVWVVLGFLGLAGTLLGVQEILTQFVSAPAENQAVEAGKNNPSLFLYFIPIVVFLNAPAEELLFRGVIQGLYRRAYGVVPAIVFASIIFGLIHYVALIGESEGRLVYVAIALASGVVLGALYEYTDSIAVPIAVHACWNVVIYANLYLQHGV